MIRDCFDVFFFYFFKLMNLTTCFVKSKLKPLSFVFFLHQCPKIGLYRELPNNRPISSLLDFQWPASHPADLAYHLVLYDTKNGVWPHPRWQGDLTKSIDVLCLLELFVIFLPLLMPLLSVYPGHFAPSNF